MNLESNKASTRLLPSTMDAWLMLCMALGLYVFSQLFLTKLSVLGGTAAGQILFFLVPSLLYARWKSDGITEALRLRWVSGGITWRVVLLSITFIGLSDLLQQATQPVMTGYFSDFLPILEALGAFLTPKSGVGLLGNLVVVGLVAPVCEEALFRGAFQGALEQRGPVRAILASTLIFAFVHLNPFAFPSILLIGCALGYVTWRTQSLLPAILWHVVNNSAATLLMCFGGESYSLPLWLNAILAMLFVGLAWEFIRQSRREGKVQPGVLATAPSAIGGRSRGLATIGGVAVAVLLVVLYVCFGRVNLRSDTLSPEYACYDFVIYTRGPAFQSEKLKTGDAVIFRQKSGGLRFSRILAMQGKQITLKGAATNSNPTSDLVVARKDIIGKIVWKFDPGEEVKQMMRQVDEKLARKPLQAVNGEE
jgi:membrane protease YdiL (CAAX protease family)